MIPLLFLALGLGGAALAYARSPKAHEWIDEHTRAIGGALAAHSAAETHLGAASTATATALRHAQDATKAASVVAPQPPPPHMREELAAWMAWAREADLQSNIARAATDVAVQFVDAAASANREAAQETARAAETARTDQQRAEAARSAAAVVAREDKIAAEKAKLGVGQCGVRSYARVTPQVKDALLARLHAEGMTVTGSNPWDIETRKYDVKLRALWDPRAQTLKLIVTAGKGGLLGLVTCEAIWERIEPILKEIIK